MVESIAVILQEKRGYVRNPLWCGGVGEPSPNRYCAISVTVRLEQRESLLRDRLSTILDPCGKTKY